MSSSLRRVLQLVTIVTVALCLGAGLSISARSAAPTTPIAQGAQVKWTYCDIYQHPSGTLSFQASNQYIDADTWIELAQRLHVQPATTASSRNVVLNALGEQGWELVAVTATMGDLATGTWTFKRRAN